MSENTKYLWRTSRRSQETKKIKLLLQYNMLNYLQVGLVRSVKPILHHLFNLALYKSSYTANPQFIIKSYTNSNEDKMPNITLGAVAKFTSPVPKGS